MARKITVKFNGKVIGTRTTDRLYTHALVLADFNPAVLRAQRAIEWREHGVRDARSGHRHATIAQSKDYLYANVTTDAERARFAELAALPVETYVAQRHAEFLQRCEAHVSRCISQGATVLSYHGTRNLAFKAQAAASKVHPEYLVLVAEADAAR